jgi:hypothetical protein
LRHGIYSALSILDGAPMKLFFVLLSLSLSTAAGAQKLCRKLVVDTSLSRNKKINLRSVYQNDQYNLVKIKKGNFGGKTIIVKLRDPKTGWKLPYLTEKDNDPPGNITHLPYALTSDISRLMGINFFDHEFNLMRSFQFKTPTYAEIPDVAEINGALSLIDHILIEDQLEGLPIKSFYSDNGITPDFNFVSQLQTEKKLPFSKYHDLNYHVAPLLVLNKQMYDASVLMNQVFLNFADWLQKNHTLIATEKVLSKLFYLRAHQIDLLGNITVYLESPYLENPETEKKAYNALRSFTGNGSSAFAYLSHFMVDSKNNRRNDVIRSVFKDITPELILDFQKTLDTSYLTPNLELKGFLSDQETVLHWMLNRRRQVQTAIQKYLENQSQKSNDTN